MKHYPILRILLAAFFLYFAWPALSTAVVPFEKLFWGIWLVFLLLIVGANLARLLQMIQPPVMEQQPERMKHRIQR